jgi:uncharacterized repeat protein (TIGR03803 family)
LLAKSRLASGWANPPSAETDSQRDEHKIMNANNKKSGSDRNGPLGVSSRSTRPLVQAVVHFGRERLLAILALGLVTGLALIPGGRLAAQTFTTLYSFTAGSTNSSGAYTNSDGANPYAGLIIAGINNIRYGTTANGGSAGYGTVFAVNADGSNFRVLHSFSGSDGANPWAGLTNSGNTLFGTTYNGGSSGNGTVFALNTDGMGFTVLHNFTSNDPSNTNSDGAYPNAGLILSGNRLYGTASRGGSSGNGTVFALNTDGTGFTNLHSFTATGFPFPGINGDGAVPVAGLILSGNTLYGTAIGGGNGANGTVFALNTDGTGFTILHSFTATQHSGGGLCQGGCPSGAECIGDVCVCRGFCGGG